jgi:hypothetical protein
MVKQQNFTIVNAHVTLNPLVFLVVAHHAQGQKLQQGTSKLKQTDKPNLKSFAF